MLPYTRQYYTTIRNYDIVLGVSLLPTNQASNPEVCSKRTDDRLHNISEIDTKREAPTIP